MTFVNRDIDLQKIQQYLEEFSVVAILGARQCGKTTLAKEIDYDHYFDLENPVDLAKFDSPKLTLEALSGLIVIDEIQRKPELFSILRYLVDNHPDQTYLILGSASKKLIRQSSESLAGRIAYHELSGFQPYDFDSDIIRNLWVRGGFPRSLLAASDATSFRWREQYVSTFLERDIPALGISIPANTLRRFWTMIAHVHGQLLNYRELGRSFGISDMTVRKYMEILESTFMLHILQPWHVNLGKRLVKQPKIYLRDSGILHSLLSLEDFDQLHSHPKFGASWEGFALEITCRSIDKPANALFFWRTHNGAELDLFWQAQGKNWGIEFKYSDAPSLSKSMNIATQDLDLSHLWVVYPGKEAYSLSNKVSVLPLASVSAQWDYTR